VLINICKENLLNPTASLFSQLPQPRATYHGPREVLLSVKNHHHPPGIITFFGLKQPNKGLGWTDNLLK
jgi:hypothetical protein